MDYLFKSTVILSIFYVFYKVALEKETFFKAIRAYFLIGIILAIALPFVSIYEYIEVNTLAIDESSAYSSIPTVTMAAETFDWRQLMLGIYLMGLVFFTMRFIIQLGAIARFLMKHKKNKVGRYFMIATKHKNAPYSFFNYIVYNPDQFKESELKHILTHEKIHARQWHSIDTILSQLMLIINWFNPLIWLYNIEIQKNLEFLADGFAQNDSSEKKNYQYLLLKTILPNYQMALTNNFYNSLIKKRINMLQKNRSNKVMYFKFALIIPMLIAFVFTFNTKVIAQHKNVKTIEIQENMEVEIITKDFTKAELETLKTKLSAKGVQFKYSKLKYNSNNEITAIDIAIKSSKGNQSKLSQSGSEPISPIKIKLDTESGKISIGNMNNSHAENVFFSSDDNMHKKIIVKKMGDGDQDLVWTADDSTKVIELKGNNGFVFISDDDHTKVKKHMIKINNDDHLTNVWVSKDGDTSKVKKFKVIEIDESGDGVYKVITKSNGDEKASDIFTIHAGDETHGKHKKMMFIDSDGANPLFIVNGKELPKGKLEDFDNENIESINILKGEKAIEKYGAKGKDGVIIIRTKK
ncbi:MAG: hypothetical protein OEM04_09285 [Flavobacteriaceae bacterium]|nr:hypothetical protein [Flavobacteriaceae bacterium]